MELMQTRAQRRADRVVRSGTGARSHFEHAEEEPFSGYPAPSWRLLDGDGFFLPLPVYEHCTSTAATCTWKKIG